MFDSRRRASSFSEVAHDAGCAEHDHGANNRVIKDRTRQNEPYEKRDCHTHGNALVQVRNIRLAADP